MANHAIIIGIDNYQTESWRLDAAVSDALAFADWAVTQGRVSADGLSLLLSPKPSHSQAADGTAKLPNAGLSVPFIPATSSNIDDVLIRYREGAGREAERLFFYYAGHGSSAPGSKDD